MLLAAHAEGHRQAALSQKTKTNRLLSPSRLCDLFPSLAPLRSQQAPLRANLYAYTSALICRVFVVRCLREFRLHTTRCQETTKSVWTGLRQTMRQFRALSTFQGDETAGLSSLCRYITHQGEHRCTSKDFLLFWVVDRPPKNENNEHRCKAWPTNVLCRNESPWDRPSDPRLCRR